MPFLATIFEEVFYGFSQDCSKTLYMNQGHVSIVFPCNKLTGVDSIQVAEAVIAF